MPIKEAKCPGCGAPVEFRAGASLVVVCDFCHFAVARGDQDIEAIGKVAALAATESTLTRGTTGKIGGHAFTVIGRLQLSYGQGTWDEWYAALDDERWCWIAEAQGKLYVTFPAAKHELPSYNDLKPGHRFALPGVADFVVVERNEANVVSAEGELPVLITPGTKVYYADFEGRDGRFGTVDFGEDPSATDPDLYLGHEVAHSELGLSDSGAAPRVAQKVKAQKLVCPKCNAPIEIQAPDQSIRVTCAHCNSMLDASQGSLRFLSALAKIRATPRVPIGKHGTLHGIDYVCIGFQRRDCVVDSITYSWDEYLLYEHRLGFRWLVESNGHWTFVGPAKAGGVEEGAMEATYSGTTFKKFSEVTAVTACVLGEFYWEVAIGDSVEVADYVAPPFVLSSEGTGKEITWSRGEYIEPLDLWQAFKLPGYPPERTGVGSNQPSPSAEASKAIYLWCGLFSAAVVLMFFAFEMTAKRQVVFEHQFDFPPGLSPHGLASVEAPVADHVFFSPPFELNGKPSNIEATITGSVANNWIGADCALINDETGETDAFGLEASYYSGIDDGESWSEGSRVGTEYLSRIGSGRYILRVEPQWEPGQSMPPFSISLKWGEPRLFYFVLALILLSLIPLLAFLRERSFEARRWADSTFGGGDDDSGSSDDE